MSLAQHVHRDSEKLVVRCVEAFNARDLDGLLACLADEVDFHPLRLIGVGSYYHGRRGVREWWTRLEHLGHEHRIVLSAVHDLGDGRVLASGTLNLDGDVDVGPFAAVDTVADGLIVATHHYLSDADMIEQLGLIG